MILLGLNVFMFLMLHLLGRSTHWMLTFSVFHLQSCTLFLTSTDKTIMSRNCWRRTLNVSIFPYIDMAALYGVTMGPSN